MAPADEQAHPWHRLSAHWIHAKKKTYCYRERDEAQRQAFLAQLHRYDSEQLVYVDESGVDDTEDYADGWCHQSECFEADRLGHRTCRISMIAGWCNRHILAPMSLTGYGDTAWFEAWVENF